MEENIYCAYDSLNCQIDPNTGEEKHNCAKYNTIYCKNCESRYDGDRIKEYMNTHERIE